MTDRQQINMEMLAALKPFAEGAQKIPPNWPNGRALLIGKDHPDNPKSHCLLLAFVEDFRVAATAVARAEAAPAVCLRETSPWRDGHQLSKDEAKQLYIAWLKDRGHTAQQIELAGIGFDAGWECKSAPPVSEQSSADTSDLSAFRSISQLLSYGANSARHEEAKAIADAKLHCVCGSPVDHSPWEGHSPVSMFDHAVEQEVVRRLSIQSVVDITKLNAGQLVQRILRAIDSSLDLKSTAALAEHVAAEIMKLPEDYWQKPAPVSEQSQYVDIVFDGPPGPEAGRFVEVENAQGASIAFGDWVQRPDGYRVLRIPGKSPDVHAEVLTALKKLRDYAGSMPSIDCRGNDQFLKAAAVIEQAEKAIALAESTVYSDGRMVDDSI